MENPVPLRHCRDCDPARARARKLLGSLSWPDLSPSRREELFHQAIGRVRGRASRPFLPALAAAGALCSALVALWAPRPNPPADSRPQGAPAPLLQAQAASTSLPSPSPEKPVGDPAAEGPAAGWERVALGDIGFLDLSPEATASSLTVRDVPGERQLHLNAGALRASIQRQQPERPVVVVTAHLRVVVVGTRFEVVVEDHLTRVSVFEGRVRVEPFPPREDGLSVLLGAGESLTSDDRRLHPLPPAPSERTATAASARAPARASAEKTLLGPVPAKPSSAPLSRAPSKSDQCARLPSLPERATCLGQLAEGRDLAAQNALYSLGLLARDEVGDPARALALWEEYSRRFPDGALAPEAALSVFETLLATGRVPQALAAAEAFEARFSHDARAPRVGLLRAHLLCTDPLRKTEGAALLQALESRTPPELLEELDAARARCGAGPD